MKQKYQCILFYVYFLIIINKIIYLFKMKLLKGKLIIPIDNVKLKIRLIREQCKKWLQSITMVGA